MSKTSDFFFSEDITYCMDGECLRTECIRHRSRAPIGVPLSWAWMRDQEGCLETAQPNVPDINDGDMISRQDAIEEIARWIGYLDEDMILRIQTGLKKLPSAQSSVSDCYGCNCPKMERLNGAENLMRPVSEIEKIIESLQEQADIYNARAQELLVEEDGQVSQYTWAVSLRETYRRIIKTLDNLIS